MQIPEGTKLIELENFSFIGKDILNIRTEKDFLYLLGNGSLLYKHENNYMIIQEAVCYVYAERQERRQAK